MDANLDERVEEEVVLTKQYFDLKKRYAYLSFGVSTIREHMRVGRLPAFKLKN